MGYRGNLGCLWLLLLIFVIGGTPLLVGVLRVFAAFVIIALLGGLALSWWIRRQAVLQYTAGRSAETTRFVELLVSLLVRLAQLDGTLDRREVAAIRHFFQYDLGYRDEQLLWIRDLIKEACRRSEPVGSLCAQIRAGYGLQERFIVIQVLERVAKADGPATGEELRFIEEVAQKIGLAPFVGGFDFGGMGRGGPGGRPRTPPPQGQRVSDALAVLGLTRGADAHDIKTAWRRLSMENHPDRVTHLGPEFRKLAEKRMREINAAYETLKEAGLAE
jgi:DnaJ like chaperone protein